MKSIKPGGYKYIINKWSKKVSKTEHVTKKYLKKQEIKRYQRFIKQRKVLE